MTCEAASKQEEEGDKCGVIARGSAPAAAASSSRVAIPLSSHHVMFFSKAILTCLRVLVLRALDMNLHIQVA
jgi:hypothetical protein